MQQGFRRRLHSLLRRFGPVHILRAPQGDLIIDALRSKDIATVLEVGAGSAARGSQILALLPNVKRYYALDRASTFNRSVQGMLRLRGDALSLPLKEESCDAILYESVFPYFASSLAPALSEARRVLRRDGTLVTTFTTDHVLLRAWARLLARVPVMPRAPTYDAMLASVAAFYSSEVATLEETGVLRHLTNAGFHVHTSETCPGYIISLVYDLLLALRPGRFLHRAVNTLAPVAKQVDRGERFLFPNRNGNEIVIVAHKQGASQCALSETSLCTQTE